MRILRKNKATALNFLELISINLDKNNTFQVKEVTHLCLGIGMDQSIKSR